MNIKYYKIYNTNKRFVREIKEKNELEEDGFLKAITEMKSEVTLSLTGRPTLCFKTEGRSAKYIAEKMRLLFDFDKK